MPDVKQFAQQKYQEGVRISALMNPTDRQRECFKALETRRYVLYGGAMGGGKSYLLRWWCVRQCLYYFAKYGIANVRVGLFCEDYPALVDRQISKIKWEFPGWLGTITDSRSEGFNFKLASEFGGGTIAFRNLDRPEKYNSAEFASIGIDELTQNEESIFHELQKRIRWPGIPDSDTRMLGATNPGGKGHAWVKRFWIDRDFPSYMESIADQFAYVQSKASDNPHLDVDYRKNKLEILPDEMRKAYAEGDWDLFAGQYFSEWRKEVHVVEPFEIPWYWKIRRCGDWGERNPCAILWIATSPEGKKWVIGEVYGAGMSIAQQSSAIHQFEDGKTVEPVGSLDEACWKVEGESPSIASQYANYKVRWFPCSKGPGSRVAGWHVLHRELAFERNDAGVLIKDSNLHVFSTCTNLIRTLPSLEHDKKAPEDLNSDGEDHAADALRYGLVGKAPQTPESELSEDEQAFLRQADKRYADLQQLSN